MKPAQWYYTSENKQYGPVSTSELKQLAQNGSIRPEDLVWRDGLNNWLPAREIKGLFDEPTPAPAASATSSPTVAPAAGAAATATAPATSGEIAAGASVEPAAAESRRLLDFVLAVARWQFTPQFVHSAARLFATIGYYTLFGAMFTVVIFFTAIGLQTGNVPGLLLGVGAAVFFAVFQYAAYRLLGTIEQFRRYGECRLGSSSLPDSFAVLMIAIGLAGLIWSTLRAAETGNFWLALGGLEVFVIGEYAAFVSLNLSWLGVTIAPTSRPSEEAIGSLTFLLKTALCCVPVVFGIEMVCGLLRVIYACFLVSGRPAELAMSQALAATLRLLASAALPLVAYLVSALAWLFVEVLRGLVAIAASRSARESDILDSGN